MSSQIVHILLVSQYKGWPKNPRIYLLKSIFILTCLKFSHLQSTLDAIPLTRCFFHCSKQFLNLLIRMPFSAYAIFCFTSFTSAKHFPLWTFTIRETKNVTWHEIRRPGRVGQRGHAISGQKLLTTHHGVGGCIQKSPTMKWANGFWKSLQNKFTEAECCLS